MKFIVGPVPSRRFGRSLGINVVPHKYCTFNCIYCQLGRTKFLITRRIMFYDPEDVIKEVESAIGKFEFDFITIIGEGEPTLYKGLDKIVEWLIKNRVGKTAILTNGSLLKNEEVRECIKGLNVIKATITTGHPHLFARIHRPHAEMTFSEVIGGIELFKEGFHGEFWVEVMLVRGLNDDFENCELLGSILRRLRPNRIHVMTPTRPPCEPWIRPTSPFRLLEFAKCLSRYVNNVEVVGGYESVEFQIDSKNPVESIISIMRVHPLRLDQLKSIIESYGLDDSVFDEIKRISIEVEFNGVKYLVLNDSLRPAPAPDITFQQGKSSASA